MLLKGQVTAKLKKPKHMFTLTGSGYDSSELVRAVQMSQLS